MGKSVYKHQLDMIFVLIVFCVFAVSVLVVLMLGGSIYKNMSQKIQQGYDEQTCLSYIWAKVKNEDGGGAVYVEDFQGVSALCFEESYDDESYVTKIYLYDGWVREIFGSADLMLFPEDGQPVIKAGALSFTQLENGLIQVKSDTGELYIYPRVQAGLAPSPAG